MPRFATGKDAYGISDRSGFRYRLREMRKEWNGSLVGPDEYESKHPQLEPPKVFPDPEALRDPRPDTNNLIPADVEFPAFDLQSVQFIPLPFAKVELGNISLSGAVPVQPINVTPTGVSATVSLGTLTVQGSVAVTLTGVSATVSVTAPTVNVGVTTYAVTVASYYGANKYYIDGVRQATLNLSEGSTYRFDQSDNTNSGHPLRFSTTSNGTHAGGSEYTTGVTTNGVPGNAGAYTQITVAVGAPTLYYYCTQHSGMGGTANTP